MSVEALKDSNEDLFQGSLQELKNQIDKPWQVEYIWNKKDNQNRNRKFYSYKFEQWWTKRWVSDKFESQLWKNTFYGTFCDKNGNPLKKERFAKWETIYYKEANTDIIDPTPEMTMDEIMKMSDNDIQKLFSYFDGNVPWSSLQYEYIEHKDKKWDYIIVNDKKIYWASNDPKEDIPYFYFKAPESRTNLMYVAIAIKRWNKLQWIYCDGQKTYRWELEGDHMYIEPKWW